MTIRADGGQLRELLNHPALFPLSEMAGFTGLVFMGTFQPVPCPGMIKGNLTPAGCLMAVLTTGFRIVLLIQERDMDIFVAVGTICSQLSKGPPVVLFMAFKTRSGQVSSCQLKGVSVVSFNGIT